MYSKCMVETTLDKLIFMIEDNDTRAEWDPNMHSGALVKDMFKVGAALSYLKTKKIAVVSSRDQYFMIQTRKFEANSKSPVKNKQVYFMAAKSKDLPEYGQTENCVRATTYLTGYYVIETEPN